ncbi:DUF1971 domain-containing protein [Brevundimonas sp. PWP3-1b1]|uniref:DUF1971 domain-containing protein n=1 Tax=unclassified Brevundimonas TaxID=2622653 RepID=UPI003CEACC0B
MPFSRNRLRSGLPARSAIRIHEGAVIYTIVGSNEERRLTPDQPGLVLPEQLHFVTPDGPMRMQVEFYDHRPVLAKQAVPADRRPTVDRVLVNSLASGLPSKP